MIDRRALLGAGLILPFAAGAQSWRTGRAPGFGSGLRFLSQAAATTFTTWNPADKSANIALSNNNLTATGSGAGFVRSVAGKSSGKFYYENTVTTLTSSMNMGVVNAAASNTASMGGVAAATYYADGTSAVNGSGGATYTSYGVGDVISLAFDATAHLVWFGKNGTWQAGNPSAGTGGVSISFIAQVFAGFTANNGNAATANFGATPFTYTPPTGFTGFTAGST